MGGEIFLELGAHHQTLSEEDPIPLVNVITDGTTWRDSRLVRPIMLLCSDLDAIDRTRSRSRFAVFSGWMSSQTLSGGERVRASSCVATGLREERRDGQIRSISCDDNNITREDDEATRQNLDPRNLRLEGEY